LVALDNDFFRSVTDLADDDIEGVRIGVARFVGLVYGISTCISPTFSCQIRVILGKLLCHSQSIPSELLDLVHRLSQDPCHGVQSYIVHAVNLSPDNDASLANSRESRRRRLRISTFSRPPPTQDQVEDFDSHTIGIT
jgi:serine/threonine-protein phosphatase 4 regulatory subunit 1